MRNGKEGGGREGQEEGRRKGLILLTKIFLGRFFDNFKKITAILTEFLAYLQSEYYISIFWNCRKYLPQ